MHAIVKKDNRLIRHCRASKYKIGPVVGMRVPLYRGGTNLSHWTMDRSQNISLHFICITFHLHYITFAFKNRAMSAQNA